MGVGRSERAVRVPGSLEGVRVHTVGAKCRYGFVNVCVLRLGVGQDIFRREVLIWVEVGWSLSNNERHSVAWADVSQHQPATTVRRGRRNLRDHIRLQHRHAVPDLSAHAASLTDSA